MLTFRVSLTLLPPPLETLTLLSPAILQLESTTVSLLPAPASPTPSGTAEMVATSSTASSPSSTSMERVAQSTTSLMLLVSFRPPARPPSPTSPSPPWRRGTTSSTSPGGAACLPSGTLTGSFTTLVILTSPEDSSTPLTPTTSPSPPPECGPSAWPTPTSLSSPSLGRTPLERPVISSTPSILTLLDATPVLPWTAETTSRCSRRPPTALETDVVGPTFAPPSTTTGTCRSGVDNADTRTSPLAEPEKRPSTVRNTTPPTPRVARTLLLA
mmetsp:Transcript_20929/g.39144  ORF Transcript_20929/g.39144 Transcript_20929/m.39144 type:complete len:271 (+) Transcript_20929:2972-3784(+)